MNVATLAVFAVLFAVLAYAALAWAAEHAPVRDEDEELGDRYPIHRRLS